MVVVNSEEALYEFLTVGVDQAFLEVGLDLSGSCEDDEREVGSGRLAVEYFEGGALVVQVLLEEGVGCGEGVFVNVENEFGSFSHL